MTRPSIIDTHVHLWDPQRLPYPWLASVPPLNRSFLFEDYAVASGPANVYQYVFVECGSDAHSLDEVAWTSHLAGREPRLQGIVAQAPVEHGNRVREHLAALTRYPLVKGVRRILQGEADPEFCLQPEFVSGVKALAEFGLTFDLCVVPRQLPAATELVRRCPAVQFILDHCAKPAIRDGQLDPWRKDLRTLSSLPNVVCKISGLVTEAHPAPCGADALRPYIAHALECFGFDRVLFGGDWPVCNLATPLGDWIRVLDDILTGESETNRAKLHRHNATRIYRLQDTMA